MGNEQSFESRGGRIRSRSQPRPSKSETSVSVDSSDIDRSATSATTPVTPSVSSKRLKDLDSPSLDLSTVSSSSATTTPHATPKKLFRQKRTPSIIPNANESEEETTLAVTLKLSAYQVQMLAQSWPRIQQTGGHIVGAKFFKHLCQKNSQAKEIFQKATIIEGFSQRTPGRCMDVYKEHGRQLFDLLNETIKCLNEPAVDVIASCRQIGAKHTSLRGEGFQGAIWDDLAELLVDHITKLDSVRRHREVSKAWTALIMYIVERVKDGYNFGPSPPRRSSTPSVNLLKLKSVGSADFLAVPADSNQDVPM